MNTNYQIQRTLKGIIKYTLMFILLVFSSLSYSQTTILNLDNSKTSATVVHDDMQYFTALFTYNEIIASDTETSNGSYCEIYIPNTFFIGELGFPKLPASRKLIEIPFGAEVTIKVLSYTLKEYDLEKFGITNKIIPVQPSVRKDQDAEMIPFELNHEIYGKDKYLEYDIATVDILGVLRNTRMAQLTIAPVSYNPVRNTIKIYNNIEVEISFSPADEELNRYIKSSVRSLWFEPVQNMLFNNPGSKDLTFNDLTKYPVKYLVVAPRMFEADLQPFIEWKTKKGFEMIVAYTDEIGMDFKSIQQWIHDQYNSATPDDPAPSFLLLVGDTPLIPSSTGSSTGKSTDLYYASVDGDYFPEMYYGRFSANNSAELISQIEKTLYYEQYQFTDPAFLDRATLIAGADASWNPWIGQPTIKYATGNYYNKSQGYSDVFTYLTSPYNGCYDPEKIRVGFVNYTAHCNETTWENPLLTNQSVSNFANYGQYPLVIGNCCLSADFGYQECLGESWVRTPGKGAVAYIGSAPNSYWLEDFYWSVGAFPAQGFNNGYVPTFAETTHGAYDAPFVSDFTSLGGIVFTGNLAVTEAHVQGYNMQSSAQYYWQAYNILGDPSLVVYHTQGNLNNVTHSSFFPFGLSVFEVNAEPGSYVAISKDGVLLGVALADISGKTVVEVEPVFSDGIVEIVVTKPQYVPYYAQIPVTQVEEPYVIIFEKVITDHNGNQNGLADYDEIIGIDLTLKNVGRLPSSDLTISLSGTDNYVSLISEPVLHTTALNSLENLEINDAFIFSIAGFVPDQYKAKFELQIKDGNHFWASALPVCVQAPVLVVSDKYIINDLNSGNNNGIIDPDETVQIIFSITNSGHSSIDNIVVSAVSGDSYLRIISEEIYIDKLNPGESSEFAFTVLADASAPLDYSVNLEIYASGGPEGSYVASNSYELILGRIPVYNLSNDVINTCNAKFYDSGGENGNYGNSEDLVMTFLPDESGTALKVKFLEFSTEQFYDKLYIYNGSDTLSPQFQGSPFHGSNLPGTLLATNAAGAITFRFVSDNVNTGSGWEAEISCYFPALVPLCAYDPFPADKATGISVNTSFYWESEDVDGYDVFIGKTMNPPFVTSINRTSFSQILDPLTTYYWKIVPRNNGETAQNCPVWSFTTGKPEFTMTDTVFMVNDGFFYDSGGPDNDYGSYEDITTTFYPFVNDYQLRFDFIDFETEPDLGLLYVYNGPDTVADMFPGSPFHGGNSPGTIISSDSSGAVTFRFVSDHGSGKPGWKAKIRCLGPLAVFLASGQNTICEGNTVQLYANATGGTGEYSYQWTPASDLDDPEIENPLAMPFESVTYKVIVNDGENIATGEQNIFVNSQIQPHFNADTTLCANFVLSLDATIPDGIDYLWTPGNITTPQIVIDSTGIGLGARVFTVTITDINGCISQASIRVAFDACTFAGNENNNLKIAVYPNPAGSVLNISVEDYSGKIYYELMNPQGQTIYSNEQTISNSLFYNKINTDVFARGLYYLRLLFNETVIVRKIILY